MSSNMKIVKACAYCKQEFIARKTTTETCSDPCAKRFYKVKQREKAIQRVVVETMVKRKPYAFITEDEVGVIQSKEWLTLKERRGRVKFGKMLLDKIYYNSSVS